MADERPKLTSRDGWALIWATDKTSFPYLPIFVLLCSLGGRFVTEVPFR